VPLPPPTVRIDDYRSAAGRIIGAALTSDKAYARLAHLTDHIGNRLSGSESLERAIEWAISEMKADKLDNVRAEKVMVPHWVRGEESLELTSPVSRKLSMLGLGNSVGTPPEGIVAEAVSAERLWSTTRRLLVTVKQFVIAQPALHARLALARSRQLCVRSLL
jgi:carboxypeptidase Q